MYWSPWILRQTKVWPTPWAAWLMWWKYAQKPPVLCDRSYLSLTFRPTEKVLQEVSQGLASRNRTFSTSSYSATNTTVNKATYFQNNTYPLCKNQFRLTWKDGGSYSRVFTVLNDNAIDENTYKYLIPNDPKPGRFYILPKLHKQGHPGRPIVLANGHPTEKISEFVSYHLNPLVQTLPSYIKNTTHFLNKLKQLNDLPTSAILVTLVVSSLYTNIPTNEGIDACRKALETRTQKKIRTEAICDLLRMILTMNNFEFHPTSRNSDGNQNDPSICQPLYGRFWKKRAWQLSRQTSNLVEVYWRYLHDLDIRRRQATIPDNNDGTLCQFSPSPPLTMLKNR